MTRQQFDVEYYWRVIIYYNVDFTLFSSIGRELMGIGFTYKQVKEIYQELYTGYAKAVTCSNGAYHTSIVLFNSHKDRGDYISSIVHEAEHVKQAMLEAYKVDDAGEPPAYTIGYLVMRMWKVFKEFL